MEFEKVVRERFSTRNFSDRKIEKDKLDKILDVGRIAPTAKNIQPIKIYVVNSIESLKKIDKASPCRYGAQTVLIICGDKENAFKKENYSTYEMDACIVATHLILEATNIGVDNIWVEMFNKDILVNEFNIPENLVPVCLIPIGYRSDSCIPGPMHNIRKSLDELVEYI